LGTIVDPFYAHRHIDFQKELSHETLAQRARLILALTALDEVIAPQLAGDTQVKRRADRVIDSAWSAGFDWLSGWCKLPVEKNPHLDQANALMALVFPDALAFTKLPYRIEWQQSKLRLDAIEREGHEKTFKQLGGAAFLANITEAQEAYGIALGITVPQAAEAASEVGIRLVSILAAVRDYVNRVTAYAEPDVPGSEELAAALLLPLHGWETTPRAAAPAEAAPAAAPAPTTP
jgi:hypothetical protein